MVADKSDLFGDDIDDESDEESSSIRVGTGADDDDGDAMMADGAGGGSGEVDEDLHPQIAKARSRIDATSDRVRPRTIASRRLSREEKKLQVSLEYPTDIDRPQTRGECAGGMRPCPFVSCSHHLYLDVNPETGAIKLNFPHLDISEMAETCALDVADRGGTTLEEVGAILNLTRERIRQVEVRGLYKIRTSRELDLDGSVAARMSATIEASKS